MAIVDDRYARQEDGPRKFGGPAVVIVFVIPTEPEPNSERVPRKPRPRWRQLELPLDYGEDGREPGPE